MPSGNATAASCCARRWLRPGGPKAVGGAGLQLTRRHLHGAADASLAAIGLLEEPDALPATHAAATGLRARLPSIPISPFTIDGAPKSIASFILERSAWARWRPIVGTPDLVPLSSLLSVATRGRATSPTLPLVPNAGDWTMKRVAMISIRAIRFLTMAGVLSLVCVGQHVSLPCPFATATCQRTRAPCAPMGPSTIHDARLHVAFLPILVVAVATPTTILWTNGGTCSEL